MKRQATMTRRQFSGQVAGGCAAATLLQRAPRTGAAQDQLQRRALIAITLDLEMSRNFPNWDDMHWDYQKGNLNEATKQYAVEAGRRVKAAGGIVHYFVVGQVFEQPDVTWLKDLAVAGHRIGNHTYDHVNVLAKRSEDIQFRFRRAPWLIEGKTPEQVIEENVRLASTALQTRIGVSAAGFRTPGGFHNGLADRSDVRGLLNKLGFGWVSSQYPAHPMPASGQEPDKKWLDQLLAVQRQTRPFKYPDGMVEIPMNPISDIVAFRGHRWKLDWFVATIRKAVAHAIETGGTFDLLVHPSCLYVKDPEFQTIDAILELVAGTKGKAAIVGLEEFAKRAA